MILHKAITTVPMSHFCSASSEGDRITKWDAEVGIYENGYMEETTLCPVCNSWVLIAIDEELVRDRNEGAK